MWRPRPPGPPGWGRGAGWGPGEGRGAAGGGPGGMKLLQMLLRGVPAVHSLCSARRAGLGLSARQGSCLSCVRAGGGAWGLRRGADASRAGSRGRKGRAPPGRQGAWPCCEVGQSPLLSRERALPARRARWQRGVWEARWAGKAEACAPVPAVPLGAGSPGASHLTSLSLSCEQRVTGPRRLNASEPVPSQMLTKCLVA